MKKLFIKGRLQRESGGEKASVRAVEDTWTKYNQEKPVFKIFKELHTDKEKQTTQQKKKKKKKGKRLKLAHHQKVKSRGPQTREKGVPLAGSYLSAR